MKIYQVLAIAGGLLLATSLTAKAGTAAVTMPLSSEHESKFRQLSAPAQVAFARLLAALFARGYRVAWIETVGPDHVPNSRHFTGNAIDLNLWLPDGARLNKFAVSDGRPAAPEWEKVGKIAEGFGIRWGGRFSNPDPNHFDV